MKGKIDKNGMLIALAVCSQYLGLYVKKAKLEKKNSKTTPLIRY